MRISDWSSDVCSSDLTNISHEIKTPLTLILAPIQQLMSLSGTNGAMKHQLRTMKANGGRLFKLINQLLDIRRFETGNERLAPERRDVNGFVHEIKDSFQHMAQQIGRAPGRERVGSYV